MRQFTRLVHAARVWSYLLAGWPARLAGLGLRSRTGVAPARARLVLSALEDRMVPSLTTLATFTGANESPYGGLVMDASGNAYGTTIAGGADDDGTVFEVAAGSGAVTTLASFTGANGAMPYGTLVLDTSGNLYGTTSSGGADGDGTVFEVAAGSGAVTTLASFTGTNGSYPQAGLIRDASGNLYGTTGSGGADNDGTVFKVAAGSGTVTTLATFNGANGAEPVAGLVRDASGNLYGTTESGGTDNVGTVFKVASGSGTVTTLATFTRANGALPESSLVLDASGNVYGTTFLGGADNDGTVFEVASGSGTVTTLATFTGTNGMYLHAGLIRDASGNLYGATLVGGADGDGTVFEVASGSGAVTTLATFNGTNGESPYGDLVMDAGGNLYGTTAGGGADNDGTMFEVAVPVPSLTTLATFTGANGESPYGGLVMDASGNAYGTTLVGGADGDGTVFEVAAGSGAVTTLATFTGTNGADPYGNLVLDASGNLYGTTSSGGADGDGTVFEVAAGSGAVTTLATFTGTGASAAKPQGGLVLDAHGNLYGTTFAGGAGNRGTVFEVAAGSGAVTTLATFTGTNGAGPHASLVMDASGNVYGTTVTGGADNDGTVFKVAAGSGTVTTLASFTGANGALPYGSLVMDARGNLYGTTESGGADSDGTVFKVAAGSGAVTTLATFTGTNGADPLEGGLVMDANGNLYGTTLIGGADNDGTVFELD